MRERDCRIGRVLNDKISRRRAGVTTHIRHREGHGAGLGLTTLVSDADRIRPRRVGASVVSDCTAEALQEVSERRAVAVAIAFYRNIVSLCGNARRGSVDDLDKHLFGGRIATIVRRRPGAAVEFDVAARAVRWVVV